MPQKYTRLEKQDDTGLYHVARIKQWLSHLRKEYDEVTELFQHARALNNPSDIVKAIQAIDIEKLQGAIVTFSDNVLALYQQAAQLFGDVKIAEVFPEGRGGPHGCEPKACFTGTLLHVRPGSRKG